MLHESLRNSTRRVKQMIGSKLLKLSPICGILIGKYEITVTEKKKKKLEYGNWFP